MLGTKAIYLAGEGEPTLHPDLPKIIEYAYKVGFRIGMATNGALYNYKLCRDTLPYLSWIRYSIDAGNSRTYKKIHGVDHFDLVVNNIAHSVDYKNGLGLEVNISAQIVVVQDNIDELEDAIRLFRSTGMDSVQIKPAHTHPKSSSSPTLYGLSYSKLWDLKKYDRKGKFEVVVRVRSMERLTEPRVYDRCHGMDFYSLISAEGDVVPCNVFYGDKDFTFGNLYEKSFSEIWKSNKRKEIIDKIEETKFCRCGMYRCRFDVMNRYLHRIIHPESNDEFI
jgi:radical SAM protein with 4Fe4S-binding SPASM domain